MSVASFIPPNSSNSGLGSLATQLTAIGAGASLGGLKNNGDVYVGILGSRSIADALISRFDLKKVYKVKKDSLAAKVLASRSEFEAGLRDGIVTIKVTDRSPERARDLANAYLDELHKTTGRLALSEASQRRLFFGEQLEKEKDDLANAEVDLKKLEERTGFIAPAGQTSVELQTIAQTRASIAVREVQLAALRQSSTDENPDVVRLRSEIADLQSQLSALERGNGPTGFTDIPKSKVPELELQYVRQEREVKYHEALFEMIAKQYESARLDESHDAPVLQVLDYGNLPDTRFGPPRAIISVVGSLLGALAGMAFVLFKSRSTLYIL
jgi:capsule polysaccharide export protein KpsE/RkpR